MKRNIKIINIRYNYLDVSNHQWKPKLQGQSQKKIKWKDICQVKEKRVFTRVHAISFRSMKILSMVLKISSNSAPTNLSQPPHRPLAKTNWIPHFIVMRKCSPFRILLDGTEIIKTTFCGRSTHSKIRVLFIHLSENQASPPPTT